jgi:hypothetical protein
MNNYTFHGITGKKVYLGFDDSPICSCRYSRCTVYFPDAKTKAQYEAKCFFYDCKTVILGHDLGVPRSLSEYGEVIDV